MRYRIIDMHQTHTRHLEGFQDAVSKIAEVLWPVTIVGIWRGNKQAASFVHESPSDKFSSPHCSVCMYLVSFLLQSLYDVYIADGGKSGATQYALSVLSCTTK